jgi:hypothetical protein
MTETPKSRLRQLALVRAVVRRSRSDWPLVLAAWLLLACSTSLISAAATFSESVATGGFHRVLAAAAPATTAVRVYTTVQATRLGAADATIAGTITSNLGDGTGRTDLIVSTDSYSPAGTDASDSSRQILVGSYQDVDVHASLAQGHWPRPGGEAVEASLSVEAARALGLALGDRIDLTSKLYPDRRFALEIVGLWQPDTADHYWLGQGLELTGVQSTGPATTRGPFVVALPDLEKLAGNVAVNAEWRWLPTIESLRPDQADGLRAAIGTLPDRIAGAYPDTYTRVDSGLPQALKDASRALLVARSSILLLFAQFAVLAAYAILLVAGMLVERRRPESALLRSRGASGGHLALLAFGEAVLLAIPAVAVAPFVAQGVVRLFGTFGPLASAGILAPTGIDATAVIAAAGAGVACVVVLTLPALPGTGTLSGVRAALGRGMGRTLAQRLGLDLALLVVAAVALWQLQLYGAPLTTTVRGDLGIDPLLVAAPAIGLLAGALVATRAVPRLGELAEGVLVRGRGLAAPLLARQLGRRPLRYTRLALLLMLAVALGTFAATFAATWDRSQSDQAAYRAAADERVTVLDHPALPVWALGPAYRSISGVTAAVPIIRSPLEIGRDVTDGLLLGIDAPASTGLVAFQPGTFSGSPVEAMAILASGPTAPVKTLPGRPVRLAVILDTALQEVGSGSPDPTAPQSYVEVSLVVAGEDGLHRFDGGRAELAATRTRVEIDMTQTTGGTAYRPGYPLALEAVELTVIGSGFTQANGTLELRDVEASDDAAGPNWRPIDLVGSAGWQWSRLENQNATGYTPPAAHPGAVSIGEAEGQTPTVNISMPGQVGATFRYLAAVAGQSSIPALADPSLLDATGALVGDTIPASRSGYESPLRIVGTATNFPTLDPATPFVVVDRQALGLVDYQTWGIVDSPREWWLGVAPGRDADVATALAGGPYSVASIVSRSQLEASLQADPIGLGVIGALGLGALAAVIIAGIGFLVTVAFLARERVGELALLRAVGESAGGVAAMLALEQILLLIYGLVAGCALGLLLGWLSIPFASLTSTGASALPPPVTIVPWQAIAAVAIPIAGVLALGAGIVIRTTSGGQIAAGLRGRDGGA